jgi:hypothetical protein
MTLIVPPGGFQGFSQMTPASKAALGARRGSTKRKKTRRKASKVARRARATTRRAKGSRKMKFGSPAWQKKYKVGKYRK